MSVIAQLLQVAVASGAWWKQVAVVLLCVRVVAVEPVSEHLLCLVKHRVLVHEAAGRFVRIEVDVVAGRRAVDIDCIVAVASAACFGAARTYAIA